MTNWAILILVLINTSNILKSGHSPFMHNGGRSFHQGNIWLVLLVGLFLVGYWLWWVPNVTSWRHWVMAFRVYNVSTQHSILSKRGSLASLLRFVSALGVSLLLNLELVYEPLVQLEDILSTNDNQLLKEENSRMLNKYSLIMGLDRILSST